MAHDLPRNKKNMLCKQAYSNMPFYEQNPIFEPLRGENIRRPVRAQARRRAAE